MVGILDLVPCICHKIFCHNDLLTIANSEARLLTHFFAESLQGIPFSLLTLKMAFKDVGDNNWALFFTFSSGVSEKPSCRNNYFFSKYVVQLLRKWPVLFRASDTSTYAQNMIFSRRP